MPPGDPAALANAANNVGTGAPDSQPAEGEVRVGSNGDQADIGGLFGHDANSLKALASMGKEQKPDNGPKVDVPVPGTPEGDAVEPAPLEGVAAPLAAAPPPAPKQDPIMAALAPILQQNAQLQQQTQAMFQQMAQWQQSQTQAQQAASQQWQAQQMQRDNLARVKASRPMLPPGNLTAEQMDQHAEAVADWKINNALEQVSAQHRSEFDQLKEYVMQGEKQRAEFERATMQANNERQISGVVAQLAQHPQYAFLKDPELEAQLYTDWYVARQNNPGKNIDPRQIAAQMYARAQKLLGVNKVATKTSDAAKMDEAKRQEQVKRGAPKTLRPINSAPQGNEKQDKMDRLQALSKKIGSNAPGWSDDIRGAN